MDMVKATAIVILSAVLFSGCQSIPNQDPPSANADLRSGLKEQESRNIYNDYMQQQAMMRQREEVARNQQRERQRQQQQQQQRSP
jgi:hypothetical protein